MDLITLFVVYAAVLLACAGSLIITWRQNPTQVGPRSWAIGSVLGAVGMLVFAATSKTPSLVWVNGAGTLLAVAGVVHYARGTRQYVEGDTATPRWHFYVFAATAIAMAIAIAFTPYAKGVMICAGSFAVTVYAFDLVFALMSRPVGRRAPSYFIAFFFTSFGTTNLVRGLMTLADPGRTYYERPIELVLIFVGIVGGAATAMGFAVLTTERLLAERKRNLERLETAVEDLQHQFEGIAAGDYSVRARQDGTSEPMDVLAGLFNQTAERVGAAFAEVDRQRSVLEATFESMLDGLLLLDGEGIVSSANPSFSSLTGFASEKLLGRRLSVFADPADRELLDGMIQQVAAAPVRECKIRFRTESGAAIRLTVHASAHRSEAGDALGMVLVVRDDRDLEEARTQLQITDRMAAMGRVAAGVAHEINNPLTFVVTNLDFALEELGSVNGPPSPEVVREVVDAVQSAHEGGERVRQIVKDLKALSRSDEETTTHVDVNPLLESTVSMLGNEIRHHARLELALGTVRRVEANEAKLGQVFMNLVHNAVQAIPPGHVNENLIRITTGLDPDGQVVVEIHDSGPGIAPEHIGRIFDAFFTTKPIGVGTGLGLSICHRVVAALDGRIEVESLPGQGTCFRVVLPGVDAEVSADVHEDPGKKRRRPSVGECSS
jgi:PAS domain S-box-containing protein